MAKENKPHGISSTITEGEKLLLDELDQHITESRAEFIRRVVVREAKKTIKQAKGK